MKQMQFKTNLKCDGCIAKIAPSLNSMEGIIKWSVDLQHPDKVLTVETESVPQREVVYAAAQAGYSAVQIE